jgi:hypothetical protein
MRQNPKRAPRRRQTPLRTNRPLVWITWLIAALAARPGWAQETPTAKATIPAGHAVFRSELGGAHYVPKALHDEYESLGSRVKDLKEDILEGRIEEEEARKEIAELQAKIQEILQKLEKTQVHLPIGTMHEKTESQTFDLGEARCLLVKARKVRIVGWDKPQVKAVLVKRVLTAEADDDSVADDFQGIQAEHERVPATEVLKLPSVESVAELTPERLAQLAELEAVFPLRYRAVARLNPERLAQLNPEIAEILARPEEPLGERSLIRRLDFEPLVEEADKEIDAIELTGLTNQEGNRQFHVEVTTEGGGGWHTSEWRRHAALTLFVPKCTMVAVRGGLEGLEVESLDAALEIVGEGDRDYQATYEIRDVRGPVTAKGVPLQVLENVSGDVSVVLTAYAEDASTGYGRGWRIHSNAEPGQYTYRHIEGDFRAWFCRANLHLEDVAGKVDVRNDFGNTVLVSSGKLAEAAHRIVSEAGHVQVKLGPDALGDLPVTALSECGRVKVADSVPSLDIFMFTTSGGGEGQRRSWGGFVTKRERDPGGRIGSDYFERFRRPAAILNGLDRSPGLDLISRGGTVQIEALP